MLQLSTSAGVAATPFAVRDVLVQDHSASLRGGSGRRTFGLGVNLSTVGAYVPGASERHLLADGDVRLVHSRSVLTATARLSLQRATAGSGLLLPSAASGFASDSASEQNVSQYTVGATATVMPSLHWTNTVIVGVDGYRLRGLSTAGLPLPPAYGDDPSAGQGAADRGSLRARAVGRFDLAAHTTLAFTFGAEQAITRELMEPLRPVSDSRESSGSGSGRGGEGPRNAVMPAPVSTTTDVTAAWTNNTGVLAQANLAWHDALFVAVGGRAERNTGATPNAQVAYLPMLGATYVHDVRGMVLKVRAAYGTGIRPARSLSRAATWMGRTMYVRANSLQPESQTGVEGGVDLLFGKAMLLHVTRFDQRASGLIQPVTTTTTSVMNGRSTRMIGYSLENVGAIDNRGWEVQASTSLSHLRLAGAYTLVDSRVARVAAGYRGDLRVGDRMLDVPARTASVSAMWFTSRWSASTTLTRAEDWISYDHNAIGRALSSAGESRDIGGARLRDFWTHYNDATRLRANFAVRLTRQLSAEIGGENLFNMQGGAPDNATVTAGRAVSFGLRTQF